MKPMIRRLLYATLTTLIHTLECMIALVAIYFLEAGAEKVLGVPLPDPLRVILDGLIVIALAMFVIRAVTTQIKLIRSA